ncbi:DNA mismatch repair endonuclease MutL [Alkalibacillus almallahensis]|uniref:DNA mismatch repair endonuclease MutL n=1 Tax=Alkalibacillus almallahensis TaxID=1379154 RepID=UPI001424A55F|nr:DNA mismatch repair endonuclease MutL [Alkalibacillus almallahensis]NIK10865.1 DNA mismatch repair protein MutL [Alkalibacillus almallahensis]
MNSIIELPSTLSNKIAAGEVVERPASVIKELLENSIDAGSTWIKIELEEAGLRSIKVIDNGRGMTQTDAPKAFGRHATSKIAHEKDLFRVETLGFRGEALASIAAVSQLTLRTSTGEETGTELVVHGGKVEEHQKHTKRQGTEIIVEHLFYNTPARLKYLKTVHTELGHLTDVINRMALSHPDIRFECEHNGKKLFFTPGNGQLLQTIQQIYGSNIAKNMLKVENHSLDYNLTGYIGKPEITRANRHYISLIVNGRYIKNPKINKAILEGYHTFLPIGRYPVVVLQIEMDPYLVDVNVHPAKTEVRFSKENALFELVKDTIYDVLHEQKLIPEGKQRKQEPSEQTTLDFTQTNRNEKTKQEVMVGQGSQTNNHHIAESLTSFQSETNQPADQPVSTTETQPRSEQEEPEVSPIGSTEAGSERIPFLSPIGQLHGTYILAQNEQGLYLMDQHAAQERIKYEYFKKKLGKPDHELQTLSVPLTFDFTAQEAITIEENRSQLESIGLYLEPFGDQSYLVRAYPTWFPEGAEELTIRDMVDDLAQEKGISIEKIREEAAILMSCKRSIKANHYLSQQEMNYLIDELRSCQDPYTCPHGRPIIVHFSDYEIQRMFKRIM